MSCTGRERFHKITELTVPYSPNFCAFVEEIIPQKLLPPQKKHKPAYSYLSFGLYRGRRK
jgi:hypothetical protein